MSTATITWRETIDSTWLGMHPRRIGEVPARLGTPDKYILLAQGEQPVLRVDAYLNSEQCFAFNDAIIWHSFLVVGWGDSVYLIEIDTGAVTKHELGKYFGHLYTDAEYLLVASGDRLWCIDRDGSLKWKTDVLGIDGVVVKDVTDGIISGDGDWDPPGGWQPFRIRLGSGQKAK